MELAPTLQGQTVQNQVREVGINPNYWYPVGWAHQVKKGEVERVIVWNQSIAIYRDQKGCLHALEDACPHKGVALHQGEIQGENILCPYHGWEFNGQGECVKIPYFPPSQKLPCVKARAYPVREQYSIIWLFPGDDTLAKTVSLPMVAEYDDPNWLMVPIPAHFRAHFSICNENTMDVFHGFLHNNLNGWFDPVLLRLKQSDREVWADYRVSYQGWLTKFLGFGKGGDRVTTRTISINFQYPHYRNSLEGVSKMYLMRLPVSLLETKSFTLLFLQIRLPQWFLNPLKPLVAKLIWFFLFKPFLDQDLEMITSEQKTYLADRQRRYVEVNPAIIALQRVILRQYEQFMQQSSQTPEQTDGKAIPEEQRSLAGAR